MIRKYGDAGKQIESNINASAELLDFFSDRTDPFVSYAGLTADPKAVLSRLLLPHGLTFETTQLNWTDHAHHNIGGNRMRFCNAAEIRRDDAGAASLPPDILMEIDRAGAGIKARLTDFLLRRQHLCAD